MTIDVGLPEYDGSEPLADPVEEALAHAIARLRKEIKSVPTLRYRGPWQHDEQYSPGDCTSCRGSLYVALTYSSGLDPRESPGVWSLAAKAGRDGRHGKDAGR